MADVFLYWCRQGVDGFRCDAGYFIPQPVWRYITAKVRRRIPRHHFPPRRPRRSHPRHAGPPHQGGLNWAYSELFQNESRGAMDWYLPQAIAQSHMSGLSGQLRRNPRQCPPRRHFPRLGPPAHRRRRPQQPGRRLGPNLRSRVVCHRTNPGPRLHFSSGRQPRKTRSPAIAALQRLLKQPAFTAGATLQLVTTSSGSGVALRRISLDGLADPPHPDESGDQPRPPKSPGPSRRFPLGSLVATACGTLAEPTPAGPMARPRRPRPRQRQPSSPPPPCLSPRLPTIIGKTAALAQQTALWLTDPDKPAAPSPPPIPPASPPTPPPSARHLSGLPFPPVTTVTWPRDERRQIVWLPGDLLLLTAPTPSVIRS